MFRILATAFFFGGAFGSPLMLLEPFGRIVGGELADIANYPYQISLRYYGSHICGASIISARSALTAAHCTDGFGTSLTIVAGQSSVSGGKQIKVGDVIQHPKYNRDTIDYDISILQLEHALSFGTNVQRVLMPMEEIPVGTDVVVTGWGALSEGGSSSDQLQAVNVPIVSRADCRNAYGVDAITDRMICAGYPEGGKDACQGDSGGPLAHNGVLYGIVSWGYGCARPGYPGVYTNVENLASWVEENVL